MNSFPVYEFNGGCQSLPHPLPDCASGDIKITTKTYPKGSRLALVSLRNAIFMGLRPTNLLLDRDMVIHELSSTKDGVWMTSLPQEVEQAHRQLARAHGRVLVGGLGLGLAIGILQQNRRVKQVVVFEKNAHVIKLVSPWLSKSKGLLVINDDIGVHLDECRSKKRTYDFGFYDIWQGTGETTWQEEVLPLREKSVGVIPQDQIECWNEDEMLGQVHMGCQTTIMLVKQTDANPKDWKHPVTATDEQFNSETCKRMCGPKWAFYQWLRANKDVHIQVMTDKLKQFISSLKNPERSAEWEQSSESTRSTCQSSASTASRFTEECFAKSVQRPFRDLNSQ